jgi:hypothetical protein
MNVTHEPTHALPFGGQTDANASSTPAGVGASAGFSLSHEPKAGATKHPYPPKVIIAVPPLFFSQGDAARYLGRGEEWLRANAIRHRLYAPSDGVRERGKKQKYHRDHLEVIAMHLLSPDVITEDAALHVWERIKANAPDAMLEKARPPQQKRGRHASTT